MNKYDAPLVQATASLHAREKLCMRGEGKPVRVLCGVCGWKFKANSNAIEPENIDITCPSCDCNDIQKREE